MNARSLKTFLVVLLTAAALLSAARGVHNACRGSQDFQWTGTHLLVERIDPWRTALDGDPQHRILLTQQPNYLPLLYVLIAPFGWMSLSSASFIWAFLNLVFAVISTWLAGRFFGLNRYGTLVAAGLFLASTPVRMTVGNGQTGLLVLLFWSLGLLSMRINTSRALYAGCSYVKFNFAPPVVAYMWLAAGTRAVLISFLPALFGTLLVWLWLMGGHSLGAFLWLLTAPFRLMHTGYFPNGAGSNLMDVLEVPLYHLGLTRNVVDPITFLIASSLCVGLLFRAARGRHALSVQGQLALMAVLSFSLFKHHTYDSVVLLFPLCHLLRYWRFGTARVALLLLAYVWYAQRVMDQLTPSAAQWTFYPVCAMLLGVAALLFRLRNVETLLRR